MYVFLKENLFILFKISMKFDPIDPINTLRPGQDGRHFPNDIFQCIFWNEDIWILIKISLKFVSKGPINNILALVQIMTCCWLGDKPLSEPMMKSLLTHICVTRLQWVKNKFASVWVMAWPCGGQKTLFKSMTTQFTDSDMCHQASMG